LPNSILQKISGRSSGSVSEGPSFFFRHANLDVDVRSTPLAFDELGGLGDQLVRPNNLDQLGHIYVDDPRWVAGGAQGDKTKAVAVERGDRLGVWGDGFSHVRNVRQRALLRPICRGDGKLAGGPERREKVSMGQAVSAMGPILAAESYFSARRTLFFARYNVSSWPGLSWPPIVIIADRVQGWPGTEPATANGAFRAYVRSRATRGYSDFDRSFARELRKLLWWGMEGGTPPPCFLQTNAGAEGAAHDFRQTKRTIPLRALGGQIPLPLRRSKPCRGRGADFSKTSRCGAPQSAHQMLERQRNWRGPLPIFPRFEWELSLSEGGGAIP